MEQIYVVTMEDWATHKQVPIMEIDHNELLNLAKGFPEIRAKVPAGVDLTSTPRVHGVPIPGPNVKPASHYRKPKKPNLDMPIRKKKRQDLVAHQYKQKGSVFVGILEHVISTGKYPPGCQSGHKSFCLSRGLVTRDGPNYVVTAAGYDKLDLWKNWSCSVVMRAVAKYLQEDKGWAFRMHLSEKLGYSKSAVGDAVNVLYQAGCLDLDYGRIGCQAAELIRWKDGAVYNSRSISHNVDYANKTEEAKA